MFIYKSSIITNETQKSRSCLLVLGTGQLIIASFFGATHWEDMIYPKDFFLN